MVFAQTTKFNINNKNHFKGGSGLKVHGLNLGRRKTGQRIPHCMLVGHTFNQILKLCGEEGGGILYSQ